MHIHMHSTAQTALGTCPSPHLGPATSVPDTSRRLNLHGYLQVSSSFITPYVPCNTPLHCLAPFTTAAYVNPPAEPCLIRLDRSDEEGSNRNL